MELTIINEQEVLGKHFTVYGTTDEPLFSQKMWQSGLNIVSHQS